MRTKALQTVAAENGYNPKVLRTLATTIKIPVTIAIPTEPHIVKYVCHDEEKKFTTKRSVVTLPNEKRLLQVVNLVKSL